MKIYILLMGVVMLAGCSARSQNQEAVKALSPLGTFSREQVVKWHESQWEIAALQKKLQAFNEELAKVCLERKKGEELRLNGTGDPDCMALPPAPIASPAKK